ncbi:MAG: hypothetical protein HY323_05585 [Betaproteobacteria bacterium]|nr:hypothetical protein [Betaproteobacteria bacterium]
MAAAAYRERFVGAYIGVCVAIVTILFFYVVSSGGKAAGDAATVEPPIMKRSSGSLYTALGNPVQILGGEKLNLPGTVCRVYVNQAEPWVMFLCS